VGAGAAMTNHAHPTGPGLGAPLTVIAATTTALVIISATWLGALAGAEPGSSIPGFGPGLLLLAARGGLTALIGPNGWPVLFWLVFALVLVAGLALAVAVAWPVYRHVQRAGTPRASMGQPSEYADMLGKGAEERAKRLRPEFTGPFVGGEIGLPLARFPQGPGPVIASHEDVGSMICGPRANKTSAVVVPAILTAPGPLITTSNKPDTYILTAIGRRRLGRVFVGDPQGIVGAEQDWWVDLLDGIEDMADALEVAQHFTSTVTSENDSQPYFGKGAQRLLAQLMLAAAVSGGHLREVKGWLATRDEEPARRLRHAGRESVAEALEGTIEAPADQKGGLYETALTAIACLESESLLRYVTPPDTWDLTASRARRPREVVKFDPWRFFGGHDGSGRSHDSLYLLTREGAGSAAPVVAALVDRLFKTTTAIAAARGGRMEPPVRAILDEAANICPIRNLPDLYSYFGSMSVQVVTILQSYEQAVAVWSRSGASKLWSASTWRLIGAGGADRSFLEDMSNLIGPHEVGVRSDQRSSGFRSGNSSQTYSSRSEPIMTAADLAALGKTDAVLYVTGHKPALLELMPWYLERDAEEIASYERIAQAEVRRSAVAALGPDNPVAASLQAALGGFQNDRGAQ
jgi:type IV secretion system protein VirD4